MRLTRWERKQAEKRLAARSYAALFDPRCLCGAPGAFPCRACFARFERYVVSMHLELVAEHARTIGRWEDDGGRCS